MTTYAPRPEDVARLDNNFRYHAPQGDQTERYQAIRDKQRELAQLLMTLCPPSRELSLALTHLEDVGYNANASIARNEKPTT